MYLAYYQTIYFPKRPVEEIKAAPNDDSVGEAAAIASTEEANGIDS